MSAAYANGREPQLGDEVISAHGLLATVAVIEVTTNKVAALGYWQSQGRVTDIFPDGTIRVWRSEVGFHDPVGHYYDIAAKHLLVGGDS